MVKRFGRGTESKTFPRLLDFLLEKTEMTESPLSLHALSKEYIKRSKKDVSNITARIIKVGNTALCNNSIEMEKRAKLCFGLGLPVSVAFLERLLAFATLVEVDECRRITGLEGPNGLELQGVHSAKMMSTITEGHLLAELRRLAVRYCSPIPDNAFFAHVRRAYNLLESKTTLQQGYSVLKSSIYSMDEYDENTKIMMLFTSNTDIDEELLQKLRLSATVTLKRGKIYECKTHDGTLHLLDENKKIVLTAEDVLTSSDSEDSS